MSKSEVTDIIVSCKSIECLKSAIESVEFNQLFYLKFITDADVHNILQALSAHSLSLGISFAQHMQSVYALNECNITDFTDTGLICSATTTVNGSSLTSLVELMHIEGQLSRVCPVISFFSLASHILFTGKIADKPVLVFAPIKELNILHHHFLQGMGMHENKISSVTFSLDSRKALIIENNIKFILNEVIAFYAHYLWSICWNSTMRAMFDSLLHFISNKKNEAIFLRLNKLNNLLVINDSLIMRVSRIASEKISHIDKHVVLNSAKLIISENASQFADIFMQSLGFKNGYMAVNDDRLHNQYHDLKSAVYMFNNDTLYDINFKSILLSFQLSGREK
ncbi:hypothetical protein ABW286_12460 [Erwinia papayae]|uniref:Uncharacterized protein n=1 Tax=Erwinia papayae TaxID=206499 RepID=A0ABV3N2M0_9GAMM